MERALITGGAGFIGSHLVELLLERGYEVDIVDKLSYAANIEWTKLLLRDPDVPVHLYRGSVERDGFLDSHIVQRSPYRYIFHLAAMSHVDNSILDLKCPSDILMDNIQGMECLLQCIVRNPDVCERLVLVSTDEVYGPWESGRDPKGGFSESAPLHPKNAYAASKCSQEMLLGAYMNTYGYEKVPGIITRGSNTMGTRQFPEKLLPLTFQRITNGETMGLYGDGKQSRQWMHVNDHCSGLLAAAERGLVGETYNLGSPAVLTNLQMMSMVCDTLGVDFDEYIEFVTDRPGHDKCYHIDYSKAIDTLGWLSQYTAQDAITEIAKEYNAIIS